MNHSVSGLRPAAGVWEWQLLGACRQADAELFFHPELERGAARRRRDAAALAVCARCPVLRRCRAHVLQHPEAYGVWGGLSEEQREQMRSARQQQSGDRSARKWRRAG
ncbi:WhiB family transcriptional regulator [Kineococcus sp. SYSU DK005]|uniref:WhiB family transcriptional regulator n=1 Tax=Kineococcus sp. SYSU DK005 TaxID=3383126 RepID=UPI003D7CC5E4